MFSIGAFARHGRVSVRMLRHYDAIGLLQPAHVNPTSGYRMYDAAQLERLNRVVALKDLGFTLQQVQAMLDESVGAGELRGMLRLRQAQLQTQITADRTRLVQVDARLRIIEKEGAVALNEVTVKRIDAMRVAELSALAKGFEPESITPVIQPLYEELGRRLEEAGLTPVGPSVAYYEEAADGGVSVHACCPVDAEPQDYDFALVDLPPIEQAATIIHRGPMDTVMSTIQELAQWIDANGYRSTGYNRELYVDYGCGDPNGWTTELQEPIVEAEVAERSAVSRG